MPLPTSGRGGLHAWAPASALCLPPAPTTTAMLARVHPPLPATPAPPPTRAAPSAAPTAQLATPPPLPSDLATNPVPPAPRGSAAVVADAAPAGMPAGFVRFAALAPAAPPAAPLAAPPPLPADLAQMFDEPIGLDGALAALAVGVQQAALQHAAGASSAPPSAPPKEAPPKRAAPPESASAPSAKRTFVSPYHAFCQDQRPLLPVGMAGRDREKLLGVLAPYP